MTEGHLGVSPRFSTLTDAASVPDSSSGDGSTGDSATSFQEALNAAGRAASTTALKGNPGLGGGGVRLVSDPGGDGDENYELRRQLHEETPQEDVDHGHPIRPLNVAPAPLMGGAVLGGPRSATAPAPQVSSADIAAFRTRIGVPSTDTVGVARTNVLSLEDKIFEGASTAPRREGGLPPPLDSPITSPNRNAMFRNHAEQDIANQFIHAVEKAGIQPEAMEGKELLMRIQKDDGICTICRQGLRNPKVQPGVLMQLSQRYPNLRVHVVVDNPGPNLVGPSDFTILNGAFVR